jgi:hypothetical protein
MGKVVTYANNNYLCYCQIKLDNGERVLISIATTPTPSVKIKKLVFFGLWPIQTIWEYNPTMAGGYEHYVRKMMIMFQDPSALEPKHPLDILRDRLLPCKSISEIRDFLFEAESNLPK